MHRSIAAGCVVCLFAAAPALGAPTLDEKTTPISTPDGVTVFSPSPAGDSVAFVTTKLRKKAVVLNGTTSDAFDEIRTLTGKGPVLFSDDGKHWLFVARTGHAWSVVVDGKAGSSFDDVAEPRFSRDGTSAAYVGTSGGKASLVVVANAHIDTKDLAGLADDRSAALALSEDLAHVAYVATADGKTTVTVDGKPSEAFNTADKPAFSPDGAHCGCIVHDDADWILVDGKKVGPFHDLSGLVWSADSQHYAAIRGAAGGGGPVMPPMPGDPPRAADDNKAAIIRDGKAEVAFDTIDAPLIFSPDGKRLAFVVESSAGRAWHIDGDAQPAFQIVHPLHFSPDSKHFAYGAESTDGDVVMLDGKPGPTLRDVANDSAIVFSPDSQHIAYVGAQDDGVKVPMLDGVAVGTGIASWSPTVAFSPGSKHLIAQDHKHVTIDGTALQTPFIDNWPAVFDAGSRLHLIVTQNEKGHGKLARTFARVDIAIR